MEGLNAQESEAVKKMLMEEAIFGAMQFDIPTPTLDAYAKRNLINWDTNVEIQ